MNFIFQHNPALNHIIDQIMLDIEGHSYKPMAMTDNKQLESIEELKQLHKELKLLQSTSTNKKPSTRLPAS
ncbi:MAG: hypothetical protein GY744_10290 [Gammaproteobacteria bacterium]|nr:hypothetical protein [Gammaproteobacteria bacterium]